MAEPTASRPPGDGGGRSVGDLVSLAVNDLSQLVRYEVDLAKLELRADARRLGLAAALLGIAGFAACLMLVLLCFALVYGLVTLGIWSWAAFLIVAGLCVVLAGITAVIVVLKVRRMSGLRRTRQTVHSDLAMLRRAEAEEAATPAPAKAG